MTPDRISEIRERHERDERIYKRPGVHVCIDHKDRAYLLSQLSLREEEIARLRGCLRERDLFIVQQGKWMDFVGWLNKQEVLGV